MNQEERFKKHLTRVQRTGWMIVRVQEHAVLARCPRSGCGLKTLLHEDKSIPRMPGPSEPSRVVESFDAGRMILRERRQELRLSIADVEEGAGATADRFAKCERAEWTKQPNTQTFIEWANALGFDVVLEPKELPPLTLLILAQSQGRATARKERAERDRATG